MRRVVVTGIGAVSPLGNTFTDTWESALKGISGIGEITKFDSTGLKWKAAGELKGFNPDNYISLKEINRLDPFIHYAVAASYMAVEDAGLIEFEGKNNEKHIKYLYPELMKYGAVIIGSSRGGITYIEREIRKLYLNKNNKHSVSPYIMPSTTISMASSYVSQKLELKGYCIGISNACASGTNAIGEGYRLIKSGYEYPVICGGTEAPLCRICFEGYGNAGALSKYENNKASRPFDKKRDGFVLSEGACILVLEEYKNAVRRGGKIYGEIAGYGNNSDAFHQTKPLFKGEAEAIKSALNDANLGHEEIDFINAHGTSTPLGDESETKAIKAVFRDLSSIIPVTSLKSMTGHMLAASGALEVAITLMSIRHGVITPTINLTEKDPECDLNIITETQNCNIKNAISNSFGFGGVNAVLVIRKIYS